jgi:hypothetical protein
MARLQTDCKRRTNRPLRPPDAGLRAEAAELLDAYLAAREHSVCM